MMVIIPKAVMPALGVAPGGKQESIPFAIQQVAHDVKYNSEDMTQQEKKLISDFLTIDYKKIPKAYDPQIADPVKGTSLKDPDLFSDFMKLWLKKTVEHPIGHLESWMGLVRGWFSFSNNDGSPSDMVVCTESAWYYDPILEYVPQWPLKASRSDTARSVYDMEQSVPRIECTVFKGIVVIHPALLHAVLGFASRQRQMEIAWLRCFRWICRLCICCWYQCPAWVESQPDMCCN